MLMLEELKRIKEHCLEELDKVKTVRQLEEAYFKYLGRRGRLTSILRSLKDLSLEEKRRVGPVAQKLKVELEKIFEEKKNFLVENAPLSLVDLTAPGKKITRGHLHPLTLVEKEIRQIFRGMNFSIVDGPEVESEYYNFDALNIPPNHPAREMWDTFWLKTSLSNKSNNKRNYLNKDEAKFNHPNLLRTHTSPVQVRYMETHQPPFQIIVPGRVFRYEATDASHEINFYQVEGLVVGKEINLSNFKFIIEQFLKKFFSGRKIKFRYRPSYFPFVEPGLEVDIKLEGEKGKDEKWLEVMGAGMVHPRVFEYAHYNPREWQGFAFGVGLDRLAMIKYKIPDIRIFYSGDLRFIRQF